MTTDVGSFRLLVIDNEARIVSVVRQTLESYGTSVIVSGVATAGEARKAFSEHYYDLALLDLYADNKDAFGVEVYRRMNAAEVSTPVIFMTQYNLTEDVRLLLQLTNSRSAHRIVGFINKKSFSEGITGQVGPRIKAFLANRAEIAGLSDVAMMVQRKEARYRGRGGDGARLRKTQTEIAVEIDRLLSRLYVVLPDATPRRSRLAVDLVAGDRRGLSAAVVVNAIVSVSFDSLNVDRAGHKTVLKIGPKADIYEEASRFVEFVRYGVELRERVELLGVAGEDALGALVYSFAGGVYKHDLLALDQALVEDLASGDLTLSTLVLSKLFDPESKSWYSVPAEATAFDTYFETNYRTDLERSVADGLKHLLELQKTPDGWPRIAKTEEGRQDRVGATVTSSTGQVVQVPDDSVLGWALLLPHASCCLVHGDMHGGNVLLETSARTANGRSARQYHRTCLIDFRNSGPGPRCIDAVSIEASIRLAEAEALMRAGRAEDGLLGRADPARQLDDVLGRVEAEKALYRAVFLGTGDVPDAPWASLSATVLGGLRACFDDVSLAEYFATSMRYTIRSLGFPLNNISRLRLVAWLGAQLELARELERGS